MRQLIIHFSDIHFNDKNNPVTGRVKNIVDAINSVFIDIAEIIIIVSGDIAYSGKDKQYETALSFFETLEKQIFERFSIHLSIFIAPGNHDRDFDYKKENELVRQMTLEGIQKDENNINDGVVNIMTEIQSSFFDFQQIISPEPSNKSQNNIFNKYRIKLYNGKSIILYLYNSAWISIIKENPGKLVFPISYLNKENFEEKANLNISIIHHPFNWNSPQNSREFVSHLKKTSDIILTGHEHQFTRYLNNNFEGDYTEFIESGALQEEGAFEKSSFNIISLDLENENHLVSQFDFDGKVYRCLNIDESWNPIKRGKELNAREFTLNKDTLDFISRPGANFSNKIKGNLALKDIYVFPDLKEINLTTSTTNTLNRFVNSKKLLQIKTGEFKVVLTGDERSGKTSLCKMLYKVAYENNLTPVYLKGRDINNTSPTDIHKLVEKAFKSQYNGDVELFKQSHNAKKIIIIDDFDKSSLKPSHRNNFLHNISNIYNKIIIAGTDLILLLDFISKKKEISEELKNYNQYEIIQFGPKLRDKLIRKWLNINIEDTSIDLDESTYKELDYISKSIKTVIGKNFIPSFPFFLLTILQAYESGKQHDLSASQYGSYYELLINLSIHKIDKKQEVITFYDNLLVEFCHFLYQEEKYEISKEKFNKFYLQFKVDYDIDNYLGSDTIIENLFNVGIFKLENEQISIFYDFIYYYYIAKFLRDTLHNRKESKVAVQELVKTIHTEKSANILMFLTHLSNEPFIYGLLVEKSKSIFSDYDISKLENDVKEINELTKEIPQLILEAKSIEESRAEQLEAQNSAELEEKYNGNNNDANDDDNYDELEIISQLNSAFKTIEITGQISRKYYAKIKADEKLELVKEVFSLGFRTIHLFLSGIANNKEALLKEIESMIKKDRNTEEIQNEIKQFLFYISFIVGNGVIKKISSSIGSSELSKTFERLEEHMPFNSTFLVNNSIKLEFNKGFSMSDILSLKDVLKDNALAYMILKQQVIDYLYTFPIEQKVRDKICTHLGIPVKTQLMIDNTSRTKK
jgi:GTPase SAR1 family protein